MSKDREVEVNNYSPTKTDINPATEVIDHGADRDHPKEIEGKVEEITSGGSSAENG